jgi:hypothetical protein
MFGVGFGPACGLIYARLTRGPERQMRPSLSAAAGDSQNPDGFLAHGWCRRILCIGSIFDFLHYGGER